MTTTFMLAVLSSPLRGHEEAFDKWYDEEHIDDMLAVEGVRSARRFRLVSDGTGNTATRFLALYQVDAVDVEAAKAAVASAAAAGGFRGTDAIDTAATSVLWFEPVGEKTSPGS